MKNLIVITMAVLAVGVSGCASVRIVGREDNPAEVERFVNTVGWSLDLEGGRMQVQLPERATLGAVEVHSSYWYAWGTVLTFGLWIPCDMTYEVNR